MFQGSFRISEPIRNGHHLTINANAGSMIAVPGSGTALSAAHEPKTAIMTTSPGQATQLKPTTGVSSARVAPAAASSHSGLARPGSAAGRTPTGRLSMIKLS